MPPGYIVTVMDRTWAATDDCGNRSTCAQRITVRDTTPPLFSAPANVVLECPADVTTNNTGVVAAQDACGAVTLSYSDVVSNMCGGTKIISRTWAATDGYNSTNVVQMITVRDTTPPTISAPANAVLEFPGDDISTNRYGLATALDGCGSVTVTYSDSISNGCGGTRIVSRLWTATDACGNRTNALQTITVGDTTPPTISAPANAVLECPADTSTNNTGVATALDACGSVTISYSDVVSNGTGGTKVIARTWTAIDQCGNSTNRVQTITVRDTAPPTITYSLVDTISKDGYAGNTLAAEVWQNNFATVFPEGLVIGLSSTNSDMPGYGRLVWEANGTGWTALATVYGSGRRDRRADYAGRRESHRYVRGR